MSFLDGSPLPGSQPDVATEVDDFMAELEQFNTPPATGANEEDPLAVGFSSAQAIWLTTRFARVGEIMNEHMSSVHRLQMYVEQEVHEIVANLERLQHQFDARQKVEEQLTVAFRSTQRDLEHIAGTVASVALESGRQLRNQ